MARGAEKGSAEQRGVSPRRSAVERRVLDAIGFARAICPGYARGERPAARDDLERLARYLNVQIRITRLDQPTILLPPIAGRYRLLIDEAVHWGTRDYVVRHELGHVLAGDADEPTILQFAGPLPEAEDVADLFAFADLITNGDCEQGEGWVRERIESLVVVDYGPWYHRPAELAPQIIRLRERIDHWL